MEQQIPAAKSSNKETQIPAQSELDVRRTLDDYAVAVRSGQLEDVMGFYADDIIAFDMMPPLEFSSKQDYKQAWQEHFTEYFQFPVVFDFHEQKIFVHGDIAFTHSLVHNVGKDKDGERHECWLRNTICLKRNSGKWIITHEHNSVPIDPETGDGMMNLKPNGAIH